MRVLMVQNVDIEGPGLLGEMLAASGHDLDVRRMDAGDRLPGNWREHQALVVLGGPMNVYEDAAYPYLRQVEGLLRESLAAESPVLGLCLGAQLMAKVLGATVQRNRIPEIGIYHVDLTEDGRRDPIFNGLGRSLPVFQWHGDTFDLPPGAVLLATAADCRHQAFRRGRRAYGFQFHWEVDEAMVLSWATAYQEELAGFSGETPAQLTARFRAAAADIRRVGRTIGENFIHRLS